MRDHPAAPVFTDPEVVPVIEAAIAATKAHGLFIRWKDGRAISGDGWHTKSTPYTKNAPEPLLALARLDLKKRWGAVAEATRDHRFRDIDSLTYTEKRDTLLDLLGRVLAVAKGDSPRANRLHAETQGWSTVFLSPDEQRLVEAHRKEVLHG